MVDGRLVNCNNAFKENSNKKGTHPDKRKVFVGGLHNDINNEELKQFFDRLSGRKVEHAYVVKNEVLNKSKGFGYIEFFDEEAKKDVLKQYKLNPKLFLMREKEISCKNFDRKNKKSKYDKKTPETKFPS